MYMGGVHRMDENFARYRVLIRPKKWWWTILIFCIDTATHNGWQVHRQYVDESAKMDYLQLRRSIVQIYLRKYGTAIVGGVHLLESCFKNFHITYMYNVL